MNRKLINWFAVLLLLTGVVLIVGVVTGAVIPLFGGIRAERIGAIAFGTAAVAETIWVVAEGFVEWAGRRKSEPRTDFPGPKRYGNKKHLAYMGRQAPTGVR